MTIDEAIEALREDPASADLVRDAYLGRDVAASVARFRQSRECAEILDLLAPSLGGATVVDLGAGIGMAAAAFLDAGAARVIAVEPDPSDEVGRGALARAGVRCEVIDSVGEALPLADGSVDVVFCRQVLHHARDLDRMVSEVARVLRPGGTLLACREHVVWSDKDLQAFLASHPVNRLAGGENAFRLDDYVGAMRAAGLRVVRVIRPYDSVINSFPMVNEPEALRTLARDRLKHRLPWIGGVIAAVPGARQLVLRRLERRTPGIMFSFHCVKP